MALDPATIDMLYKTGIKTLSQVMIPILTKKISNISSRFEVDYGPHIRYSFEKCQHVRTLLNRDRPIPLMDIFIGTDFKCGDKYSDHISTLEQIYDNRRALITGTGGGGKTMFMKYIWCCFFERPFNRIPLFIELRNFNGNTKDSFYSFLFRTAVSDQHAEQSEFNRALFDGNFCLILDGFDEVPEDSKPFCEAAILDIAARALNAIIVVSGRQDDRFSGWTLFQEYRVQPLDIKKTVELISKLDFDKKIKSKFISRVKKDLFKTHKSFLSNPLLSTMMLLTFDQFADIPDKIHLFYDQAFYTLFSRHDATKEGFKRRILSGLSVDVFKEILSLFCLVSYFDYTYEFDDASVLSVTRKALKISGRDVDADKFLRDLIESVCILQRDGLSITFTHRSFQEFFCANALVNVVPAQIRQLMPKILSGRPSDSVSMMCMDMNRDLVESQLLIPSVKSIVEKIDADSSATPLETYLRVTNSSILARYDNPGQVTFYFVSSDDDCTVVDEMQWLYEYDTYPLDAEKLSVRKLNFSVVKRICKKNSVTFPVVIRDYDSPADMMSRFLTIYITDTMTMDALDIEQPHLIVKASASDFDRTNLQARAQSRLDSYRNLNMYFSKKTERRSRTIEEIFFSTEAN